MARLTLFVLFSVATLATVTLAAYQPGSPGAPWTDHELKVVREKITAMMICQEDATKYGLNDDNLPLSNCWKDVQDEGLDEGAEPQYIDSNQRLGYWTQDLNEDLQVDAKTYRKDVNNFKRDTNVRYKWRHRGPRFSRLIQLAFHDCLTYDDGTGGCDGCINWSQMGDAPPSTMKIEAQVSDDVDPDSAPLDEEAVAAWNTWHGKFPKRTHTNNNKLQLTARSLELIYRRTDWPPGTEALPQSLYESGKSRADLWAFAGQVGLERAMMFTNYNCDLNEDDEIGIAPGYNMEFQLAAMEGVENCKFKLRNDRVVPFRSGRSDCVPDADAKWTPYPFEATKTENHANAYGSGNQAIDALHQAFGFTDEEAVSLMALHGLAQFGANTEEVMKYKWIGGSVRGERTAPMSFSNMYFKTLASKIYKPAMSRYDKGIFVGDSNGQPANNTYAWVLHCHPAIAGPKYFKADDPRNLIHGGPCHFKMTRQPCYGNSNGGDDELRKTCYSQCDPDSPASKFVDATGQHWRRRAKCQGATLVNGKDGRGVIQIGGPPVDDVDKVEACEDNFILQFAMPYEVGMVMDFKVDDDNIPEGCGQLDKEWDSQEYERFAKPKPSHIFIGDKPADVPEEENNFCPRNERLAPVVEKLAADNAEWQEVFLNAWEKMQQNGYGDSLVVSPAENGNLKIE